MEAKTNSTYRQVGENKAEPLHPAPGKPYTQEQVGDLFKAMLLEAYPQSDMNSLASYQICKIVLKNEEVHEYEKLDKVRCSSNKAIVISGPISLISFMAAGLMGNIYVFILSALAGVIYLVAAIKASRAEKQINLIEDMARAKFEKDWDGTTALDRFGQE